jgi:hypothetical protein
MQLETFKFDFIFDFPTAPKSPVKSQERTEGGVITYGIGNNKKTIMYFLKDCEKSPRIGDNVKFNICQVSI